MILSSLIEALLFAATEPLSVRDIVKLLKETAQLEGAETAKAFSGIKENEIIEILQKLQQDLQQSERGFLLEEVAEGYRFISKPEYGLWLRQLRAPNVGTRLSLAALETLAIIAYRQPISRAEVEGVRGVACDAMLAKLMERGLIAIAGKAETPGRPLIYQTTPFFLEFFGFRDIAELPNAAELGRVLMEKVKQEIPEENAEESKEENIETKSQDESETVEATDRQDRSKPLEVTQ
ncbi:MAG: SMC-Scp complex subunit ScpB [Verrucomicrobiae bacterium]|nr:SMC-Scp complex subunit ScpB [Verrucomicrobiae bacterium]